MTYVAIVRVPTLHIRYEGGGDVCLQACRAHSGGKLTFASFGDMVTFSGRIASRLLDRLLMCGPDVRVDSVELLKTINSQLPG